MREFLSSESYFRSDYLIAEINYFNNFWHFLCHINELSEQPLVCYVWNGTVEVSLREGKVDVKPIKSSLGDILFVEPPCIEVIFGMVFYARNKKNPLMIQSLSGDFLNCKMQEYQPLDEFQEVIEVSCNWKLLVEISLDETHVAEVHPEYSQLMRGATGYRSCHGVRNWQQQVGFPGLRSVSAIIYWLLLVLLKQKKEWNYLWIFPNLEIEIYPEQAIIYQIIPISESKTLKVSRRYGSKKVSLIISLMRFLNKRIQNHIDQQDISCVLSLQEALSSKAFHKKHLLNGDGLVKKFYEIVKEAHSKVELNF